MNEQKDKTNIDPDLHRGWLGMNNEMKKMGIKAYFEKSIKLPRYK